MEHMKFSLMLVITNKMKEEILKKYPNAVIKNFKIYNITKYCVFLDNRIIGRGNTEEEACNDFIKKILI